MADFLKLIERLVGLAFISLLKLHSMKNLLYVLGLSTVFFACTTNQTVVLIPAQKTVELDYPEYDIYAAQLRNKSLNGLGIAVFSKDKNEQVRGFGLGPKSGSQVMIERESKLVIKNNANSASKLVIEVTPKDRSALKVKGEAVSFTLENTSSKSIPLLIPSVMNPNLSPQSKSRVTLKIGQEILFKHKGKRYVLLTVDESIAKDLSLDIPRLLEARKKELGLK